MSLWPKDQDELPPRVAKVVGLREQLFHLCMSRELI